MRRYSNNLMRTAFIIATLMITSFAGAQEAFLQLDSIVIKQGDLSIAKVPSRSVDYEGHDTIVISKSNDQIILIRYCGITMGNPNPNFGSTVSVNINNTLYDLRISTQKFNLLSAYDWLAQNTTYADQGTPYYRSKQRLFESRPDIFLDKDENLYIDYIRERDNYQYTISWRVELVYYSYE